MVQVVVLLATIVILVLSIVRFKVHPFLMLLLSGILLGFLSGMPFLDIIESLQDGFAGTLRWIGIVMVLGTVIGEILHETGGSIKISNTILRWLGPKQIPVTMGLTGYIVAIPVFVDVAYIMLQPITESLAVKSKRNVLVVGLSLTAGLTATHALLPPTPGPLAAAGIMSADLGKIIVINIIVAIFVTAGGLLWSTLYCKKIRIPYDDKLLEKFHKAELHSDVKTTPTVIGAFAPIILPLILIAAGSFAKDNTQEPAVRILQFVGSPTIALLLGVFVASVLLKRQKENRMNRLHAILDNSIKKAAVVIMITGAGGAFGGVIKASPIGQSVADTVAHLGIPGLLFPFLLAAAITTSTGSLTVSMVTTSSIIGPMTGTLGLSPELAVALVGAGSLCVIHTNSSFFWLLSRLHNVEPTVLLRTLTLQSLAMGLSGLTAIVILRLFGIH